MIEKIRDYIATCPYLDEFTAVNVEYLVDKVKAYSVNENASYNPVLETYLNGSKLKQFNFSFDAKFHWNEDIQNNVDNSEFFENFRNWLENNNDNDVFPQIEGITPVTIGAVTPGYIFATSADEAIYRIGCRFEYLKEKE